MTAPVLQVEGLTATFRGTSVLDGVSLDVAPGECLAVVGASGAGKSVLARTLLGLTGAADRGRRAAAAGGERGWSVDASTFEVAGHDALLLGPRAWRGLRGREVGLVLQDALQSLDPLRTIEAEVGEALATHRVPKRGRRRAVIDALDAAGLPDAARRLRQRSLDLSGGMRQRALIAAALVGSPRLLIADEPTTALDATTAVRVLDLFAEIRDRGTSILLISHDLHAVSRVADRIAVIESGRIIESGPAHRVLTAPETPAARELVAAIPHGAKPGPQPRPGPELVRAEHIARTFPAPTGGVTGLRSASLTVRAGEAVGVVGESGAGKSTLARVIIGAENSSSGSLTRSPGLRARLIPQDPLSTFDPRWRVDRILAAAVQDLPDGSPRPTPAELLEQVGLSASLLRRRPASLSGGQRQRVAIARALAADPSLLVCDEPVSALDVATQAGVLSLLRSLQQRGMALLFVSHDLAVVRTVCDRVCIMQDGTIVEEGATEDVFSSPAHPFTRELIAAGG